jgi:ABC-2 type transport system permease protein
MFQRILNLIYKELLQFSRDRLMLGFVIIGPILQLALMGFATGKAIQNLPLAVLDMDHSATSRAVAHTLDATKELTLSDYPEDMTDLTRLIQDGDIDVGVVIPPNFERDLNSAYRTPQIQVIAGTTNNNANVTGMSAAEGAISTYLNGRKASVTTQLVDLRYDVRFNPTFDTRQYTIPAMTGMIIFELTLLLASSGLSREREIGTLEQLIIMPFQRIEIIIGKAIPPVLITLADFPIMLAIAVLVFDTPMRGSALLLTALTILFMCAEVSWGLTLSTLARTQQQSILFVFVQAIVDVSFSGFLVPVEYMPAGASLISNLVPMRHYLIIIRGIMLKGATLDALWPQVLALIALTIAMGALARLNLGRHFD